MPPPLTIPLAFPPPPSTHIEEGVYILCALTALACAILQARAYMRGRARILFWSAICFGLLTVNSLLLYLDLVVLPDVDLTVPRDWSAFLAMAVLVAGLIWEAD